ncbi:MAG: hypothetical protein JNJ58_06055 [Chitinophagaceae bacterium]|nr:hypothetical protein [Chitinophagaceae bacterium]
MKCLSAHKIYSLLRSLLIVSILCSGSKIVSAQLFPTGSNNNTLSSNSKIISDTNKKQITTDDRVRIVTYTLVDTQRRSMDTSIKTLHRNPLQSIWHVDLGNTGSTAQFLLFVPDMNPGMQLGVNVNHPFLYRWQNIKFYNTTRPYSVANYRMGTKQEQILELLHTQNILPHWNVQASYRKTGSPGFYKLQRTNHDQAVLSSNYQAPGQRYQIHGALIYNKLQQDENGGITSEDYLLDTRYNDKRLVPVVFDNFGEVNRSSVSNYYRNASIYIQQQYFWGNSDSVYSADSSEHLLKFKPIFGLKHTLYGDFNLYRYKDRTPDSLYYSRLENISFLNGDSLYMKYFHRMIGTSLALIGNVRLRDKVLQAEAGWGIDVDRPLNGTYNPTFYNNYIFGSLLKDATLPSEWLYKASLKLYFTGNAKGNFLFDAEAGKNFSERMGSFRLGLKQSLQSAPYLMSVYASNYYDYSNTLLKPTVTKIFAGYKNEKYHGEVMFNYLMLGNYIFRDTNLNVQQWNDAYVDTSVQVQPYRKTIPLFQLIIQKQFRVGKFYLDNSIALQTPADQSPVHVPWWMSRHRLAFEDKIFKKKLLIATGIEMRYNTPYLADRYAPTFNAFLPQYERRIRNYPQWTAFFNFKLKRFRASIAVDEIQQLLVANNINYAYYPAQNFGFRFGLSWVFVN